jgi:hypothetical protein
MYDITNPPAKLQLSQKTRNLERRTAPLHRTKIKTPPPAAPHTSTLPQLPSKKSPLSEIVPRPKHQSACSVGVQDAYSRLDLLL